MIARFVFAAILLAVLIALPDAVAADSGLGSWETLPSLAVPRWSLAVVASGGRLYAIGGVGGGQELHTVEAYDPATNGWTARAPMPTARSSMAAAAGPDGRIYVMGGYVYAGGYVGATQTLEAYDPAANTWTALAGFPGPRESLAAATGADGSIYAIGGTNGNNDMVGTVQAYAPATNRWTQRATMPTPRYGLAAVAGPDGRIYAIGGAQYRPPVGGPRVLTTVEAYSPATNTWATVAGMHEPRYAPAATVGADGRIYVIGGSASPATALASVEAYDPATNTWAELAPLRIPRELAGAAAVGTRIYVAGGINVHRGPGGGTGVLGDVEAYLPACRYVLGFQALHDQLPSLVGDCTSDESHNPINGDALQHTTNGLLVWRKADNTTAFTDGYHTWVNGPYGVQERLNSERFLWEASPT